MRSHTNRSLSRPVKMERVEYEDFLTGREVLCRSLMKSVPTWLVGHFRAENLVSRDCELWNVNELGSKGRSTQRCGDELSFAMSINLTAEARWPSSSGTVFLCLLFLYSPGNYPLADKMITTMNQPCSGTLASSATKQSEVLFGFLPVASMPVKSDAPTPLASKNAGTIANFPS